jgi:sigma-B regulation protein RsbU (phosphoserine phosphatase)
VGRCRFAALYRPYEWVSGDIYDIARLDETHVGVYIVDAVGHGMPAALLTMFIKKGLQTKRIEGDAYQIVPPAKAMAELNADICQQELPSCQFCTAFYAVIDTANETMTYCRAGHPEPLLYRRGGVIETLNGPGALLGVFPEEQYVDHTLNLRRGDRLVLYTDGVEEALRPPGAPSSEAIPVSHLLRPVVQMDRSRMILTLSDMFDSRSEQDLIDDDISLIVMDVE